MSLRPNPLSPGRASPFRRPESPTTTTYQSTRPATPSRLNSSSLANADGSWSPSPSSPSAMTTRANLRPVASRELSPTKASGGSNNNGNNFGDVRSPSSNGLGSSINSVSSNRFGRSNNDSGATTAAAAPSSSASLNTEALSKLPAAQVRELREAYSILDRSGSGGVTRADVADMLGQLGLESGDRAVAGYFPSSTSPTSTVAMPAFLSGIASSLARMSPPAELLAALAAFDDDDSGQIDTADLVDALASGAGGAGGTPLARQDVEAVMADFVGRRAFNKYSTGTGARGGLGGGEVFRYREWVAGLGPVATGGSGGAQAEKVQAA